MLTKPGDAVAVAFFYGLLHTRRVGVVVAAVHELRKHQFVQSRGAQAAKPLGAELLGNGCCVRNQVAEPQRRQELFREAKLGNPGCCSTEREQSVSCALGSSVGSMNTLPRFNKSEGEAGSGSSNARHGSALAALTLKTKSRSIVFGLVGFLLLGLPACGDRDAVAEDADAFVRSADNQRCETNTDCVVEIENCAPMATAFYRQVAMNRAGATSQAWQLLKIEIGACEEDSCVPMLSGAFRWLLRSE